VRKLIQRHPTLSAVVVFIFWSFPQWLAGIWALYSSEPLAKFLPEELGKKGLAMPHFSPFWVTTPIAAVGLGFIIYQVKQRPLPPPPTLEKLEDEDLHRQAANWLMARLSDRKLGVSRAILFGSVVYDHFPSSDVDVIVLFKAISDKKVGSAGRRIKAEIGRQFKQRFDHPLHAQLYHASEEARFSKFLSKLEKYEELPLGDD
jgi:predicted nucleotidyltransferase